MPANNTDKSDLTGVQPVLIAAKKHFALNLRGVHGIRHWTRVRENGHRLARHTGANKLVVELFAFLHDCCRENDRFDLGHGERAAEFTSSLRGTSIHLEDADFELLVEAIRDHENGRTSGNATIGTCWDADRLDLGRVRKRPDSKFLSTEFASRRSTIEWAYKRSLAG